METDLHVVYLTEKCNLACKYCYEKDQRNDVKMTKETAKSTIDNIMAAYDPSLTVKILLFGGEPFLNWDVLLYAVDYIYNEYYIKRHRVVAVLTTSNGTLVKKDRVRKLFQYRPILNVEISIDGDRETQDANRAFVSGVGSHDIVIKNVRTLLQYFPFATARMVITDADKYFDNVVYLHKQGFKQFVIQAVRYQDKSQYQENYAEKFNAVTEKVIAYLKQDKFAIINSIQYPCSNQRENSSGHYNYILPDGGRIRQEQYVKESFQHFTKGVHATYNLLNRE